MADWDPKWGPPPPPPSDASARALAEAKGRMPERPPIVTVIVVTSILSVLVSLYLSAARSSCVTACVIGLEAPLLYFLWVGRNWARMLYTGLSILGVAAIALLFVSLPAPIASQIGSQITGPARIKLFADVGLSLIAIVGLNTRDARAFFVESSVRR